MLDSVVLIVLSLRRQSTSIVNACRALVCLPARRITVRTFTPRVFGVPLTDTFDHDVS